MLDVAKRELICAGEGVPIEPQVFDLLLYFLENRDRVIGKAQRKAPDSMDAWDLVMRALSHYWRVTRQDNMVAQALLEKAIKIDREYGHALGVLAATHIFGAHMGWEEMAKAMPTVPARRGVCALISSAPTASLPPPPR